jgi:hypothetical protein
MVMENWKVYGAEGRALGNHQSRKINSIIIQKGGINILKVRSRRCVVGACLPRDAGKLIRIVDELRPVLAAFVE